MGRHVEHGDDAGEEGEGSRDVQEGEVLLSFDLMFDVRGGGFHSLLEFVDLTLFGCHAEGEGLELEE